MKTIYLVVANYTYEGCDPVRAYTTEIEALRISAEANKWLTLVPTPLTGETPAEYRARNAVWRNAAPVKDLEMANYYNVQPVELEE